MKTGLQAVLESAGAGLRGRRLGLLVHPASVGPRLEHAVDLLGAVPGLEITALFGPQHGILGQTQDNMIEWEGDSAPAAGPPVYSLYGQHRKPTPEMLDRVDALVVDLQDVGARYYTFIWTMLLAMEACAENGKALVLLDRPNPLGGVQVEGTVLDPDFASFVGLAPLPMRHAMTMGELALFFRHWAGLDLELTVVWMEGWRRKMYFGDTGLPWVMPSPNMPTPDTALVYPGGCLLEGTNLSEGRGTTRPFEIFGAPYIEPRRLADELARWHLPGCRLRPLYFEPTFHKFQGRLCGGLQVHVTDPAHFEAVTTYTAAIAAARRLWPEDFAWREPPYEYETVKRPIDILAGGTVWRRNVEENVSPWRMKAGWLEQLRAFTGLTAEFRHYG